jgi:hypothetical protein
MVRRLRGMGAGIGETRQSPQNQKYPSDELIQYTIQVWEPRLRRKLTEEDARQILENMLGVRQHPDQMEPRRSKGGCAARYESRQRPLVLERPQQPSQPLLKRSVALRTSLGL